MCLESRLVIVRTRVWTELKDTFHMDSADWDPKKKKRRGRRKRHPIKEKKREKKEVLPESGIAVEFDTQRHEKERGKGKDGLAQSQRKAGAGPQGARYLSHGYGLVAWDLPLLYLLLPLPLNRLITLSSNSHPWTPQACHSVLKWEFDDKKKTKGI